MKLTSPNKTVAKSAARNHARAVWQHARYVIIVDADRTIQTSWHNPEGSLGVIAVLGPALVADVIMDQVILLEIGLGSTRPYKASSGGYGRRKNITDRRFYSVMSSGHMQNIWPEVELMLWHDVTSKIAQRRNGHRYVDEGASQITHNGVRIAVPLHAFELIGCLIRRSIDSDDVGTAQGGRDVLWGIKQKFGQNVVKIYWRKSEVLECHYGHVKCLPFAKQSQCYMVVEFVPNYETFRFVREGRENLQCTRPVRPIERKDENVIYLSDRCMIHSDQTWKKLWA